MYFNFTGYLHPLPPQCPQANYIQIYITLHILKAISLHLHTNAEATVNRKINTEYLLSMLTTRSWYHSLSFATIYNVNTKLLLENIFLV